MKVAGLERIIKIGQDLEKVVVAEILKIKPHPQADKLQIVIVDTGRGEREIVCGASNIKVGQKVPLALPGARLPAGADSPARAGRPNGVEIKPEVIRGVKSNGMLCAEDELGLGSGHGGILILPGSLKVGENLAKALGLDEIVLEIENKSLTHRPDLFSHLGFAKEISAVMDLKVPVRPFFASKWTAGKKNQRSKNLKSGLKIKIKDKKFCPRYMAAVMDGITVKPSPQWLQNRLRNLGIKPVNNVVDITNYVLLEIGQPLHAFDFGKVSNAQVIIRKAKKGEKLLALDEREYKLTNNDLVIADKKKPIALAGIIGGEHSGIGPKTRKIIIESANFEPIGLRRTSWRLGLRTEAVLRFEKGLPLVFAEWGLSRAIELMQELAGGKLISGVSDIKSVAAQKGIRQRKKIVFNLTKASKLIGGGIKSDAVKKILENIGCVPKPKGRNLLTTVVPVYRADLNSFEDLVEEVIRVYGVEKIIPKPILAETRLNSLPKDLVLEKELKNILTGLGFDEVYNYSLVGQDSLVSRRSTGLLEISNPLSPGQRYLRTSLLPGLLKNVQTNKTHFSDFKIFEIGKVFCRSAGEMKELKKVAGLIFDSNDKDIYFTVKGVAELIFEKLSINKEEIRHQFHGGAAAMRFLQGNNEVGHFSSPKSGIGIFEFDFDSLLKLMGGGEKKKYRPISVYPLFKRDLAFLFEKSITWQEIVKTVTGVSPLIQKVELFDVFESKELGDKRNVAFHLIFQSSDKTLKSEEVDKIQKKIIKTLQNKYQAKLRDF